MSIQSTLRHHHLLPTNQRPHNPTFSFANHFSARFLPTDDAPQMDRLPDDLHLELLTLLSTLETPHELYCFLAAAYAARPHSLDTRVAARCVECRICVYCPPKSLNWLDFRAARCGVGSRRPRVRTKSWQESSSTSDGGQRSGIWRNRRTAKTAPWSCYWPSCAWPRCNIRGCWLFDGGFRSLTRAYTDLPKRADVAK